MARDQLQRPVNVNTVSGVAFSRMTAFGKIRYVGKVMLFIVTFGFAYPNIFIE